MLGHPIWRFTFAVGASGGTPAATTIGWAFGVTADATIVNPVRVFSLVDAGQSSTDR